jgi:S1-C subfamily serine protease
MSIRSIQKILAIVLLIAGLQVIEENPGLQAQIASFQQWASERIITALYQPSVRITETSLNVNDPAAKEAVAEVSPAVATVLGMTTTPGISFGTQSVKITSGTGFFIDSNGYLVTNKHVVPTDEAKYSVVLSNGQKRTAKVVYRHPDHDIAMLKVSGDNFPTVDLGSSSSLKSGQSILAIGNSPARLETRVSSGKVISPRRTFLTIGEDTEALNNVIQSTAELYEGDSGGPLFTPDGKVVGVNMAIAVGTTVSSFSVPIDAVSKDLNRVINNSTVSIR